MPVEALTQRCRAHTCTDVECGVCLSVCPSRGGIELKQMTVGSCGFHGQIAQQLVVSDQLSYARSAVNTSSGHLQSSVIQLSVIMCVVRC